MINSVLQSNSAAVSDNAKYAARGAADQAVAQTGTASRTTPTETTRPVAPTQDSQAQKGADRVSISDEARSKANAVHQETAAERGKRDADEAKAVKTANADSVAKARRADSRAEVARQENTANLEQYRRDQQTANAQARSRASAGAEHYRSVIKAVGAT